jgi:hypothetical protein
MAERSGGPEPDQILIVHSFPHALLLQPRLIRRAKRVTVAANRRISRSSQGSTTRADA